MLCFYLSLPIKVLAPEFSSSLYSMERSIMGLNQCMRCGA
jgi:hypothetical protein